MAWTDDATELQKAKDRLSELNDTALDSYSIADRNFVYAKRRELWEQIERLEQRIARAAAGGAGRNFGVVPRRGRR